MEMNKLTSTSASLGPLYFCEAWAILDKNIQPVSKAPAK
jgi:hypothetical protein